MFLSDVLYMELGGHVYQVQLRSTLPWHKLLALLHMVRVSLSVHLPPIGCIGFLPDDGSRLTHHFHHLFHVIYDTKNDYYDVYNNKLNDPITVMLELVDVTDGVLAEEEIE